MLRRHFEYSRRKRDAAYSLGLSLNDSFWTLREGDERRFQDVNLYGNGFSSGLASVTYMGQLTSKIGAPELDIPVHVHEVWVIIESEAYQQAGVYHIAFHRRWSSIRPAPRA